MIYDEIIWIIIEDLKLLEVIGKGSFGTVYKAAWHGTMIAAKVVSTEAGDLSSEMKILLYDYVITLCNK